MAWKPRRLPASALNNFGPASAISTVPPSLGAPIMLAVIHGVIMSRTLHLGGVHAPVKSMNDAQLHGAGSRLHLRLSCG
ncbi:MULTISPECIES: hypothetical protein [unclassified Mycobacterium]|uniref:hypothetical protein n=1 Tax=unclassified Mycobacterium TaxID=2642494 RepID=UPI0012EA7ADE